MMCKLEQTSAQLLWITVPAVGGIQPITYIKIGKTSC